MRSDACNSYDSIRSKCQCNEGLEVRELLLAHKKKYYVEKEVEFLNQDRSEKTVNIQR